MTTNERQQTSQAAAEERLVPKALVIDDSRTGRRIVTTLLSFLGFDFVEAACGDDAFLAIARSSFDLVTVDRNLDGEDGVDLVRILRAHPRFGEMPRVLALTGNVGREHSDAFFDAGADAFLAKPFNVRQLAEILLALGFDHFGQVQANAA